jgi:putative glutamine amidotransferase
MMRSRTVKVGELFAVIAALVVVIGLAAGCAAPGSGDSADRTAAEQAAKGMDGERPSTLVLSKFYTSRSYRDWLTRLADAPLIFVEALGLDSAALEQVLLRADGVVLTGGEDIHPGRYNQAADTVRCGRIDVERDHVESQLTNFVWAHATPCLGVCRGLQYLNVHTGGSLHPHLPDAGFTSHRGGQPGRTRDTLHVVEITRNIFPGGVPFKVGDSSPVISHHHQGIDRLAQGWDAWALSQDGLIEGIRWADTVALPFVVGVQWHPERTGTGPLADPLGVAFLAEIAKN